jgi:DNA-binding phage protein
MAMDMKATYKKDLLKDLKSPGYAAKYLSAAHADSPEALLVALRDVAGQAGRTRREALAGHKVPQF